MATACCCSDLVVASAPLAERRPPNYRTRSAFGAADVVRLGPSSVPPFQTSLTPIPNFPLRHRSLSANPNPNPSSSRSAMADRGRSLVCSARARKEDAKRAAETAVEKAAEEEEVELSWVEEKLEDLAEYSSSVVRAVPGPRVGDGELPWLLALPLGYASITLVFALVKTVRRYTAPEGKRRRQIGKNAWLLASLGDYLPERRDELDSKMVKQMARKCRFEVEEVLRKYVRYALNERPFDPELVADLIHLRKVSLLGDESVAEILNEVSRRIVKSKGPVVADTTGFTEKGLKRKVAVQALFSKILYLAELNEFCSTSNRSSLSIKEIFGVTDEDANSMRIETLSGETEVESLEQLVSTSDDDGEEEEM